MDISNKYRTRPLRLLYNQYFNNDKWSVSFIKMERFPISYCIKVNQNKNVPQYTHWGRKNKLLSRWRLIITKFCSYLKFPKSIFNF